MVSKLWRQLLDRTEPLVEVVIRVSGWSAILFVFAIFFFIIKEGYPLLLSQLFDTKEFFTSTNWRPDSEVRPQYGILALLVGTLSVTTLAMLIAVPFGLGAAIYVSEVQHRKIARDAQDRHRAIGRYSFCRLGLYRIHGIESDYHLDDRRADRHQCIKRRHYSRTDERPGDRLGRRRFIKSGP